MTKTTKRIIVSIIAIGLLVGGYFVYDKIDKRLYPNSPEGVILQFGEAAAKGDMELARSFCTGRGKIEAYILTAIYVAGDRMKTRTFKEDIEVTGIDEQERWGDTAIVHVYSVEKGVEKVKVVTTVKENGKWLIDKIEK